jgi:diadenosine tetraphosphate (Ap4A) HIT family hydrolase
MKRLLSRQEYEKHVQGLPKGVCPLCDIKSQISLGESSHWYWIANMSPYWKWHTMLIPKRHEQDMDNLTKEELEDYFIFHKKIITHLHDLGLIHDDGKKIDQFITMTRTRFPEVLNGSTYYKPDHLHVHVVPDREGVSRFVLDDSAPKVDIVTLSLPAVQIPSLIEIAAKV